MPRRHSSKLLRYSDARVKVTESRSWMMTIYCTVSQRRRSHGLMSMPYTIAEFVQSLQYRRKCAVMGSKLRLAWRIQHNRLLFRDSSVL